MDSKSNETHEATKAIEKKTSEVYNKDPTCFAIYLGI